MFVSTLNNGTILTSIFPGASTVSPNSVLIDSGTLSAICFPVSMGRALTDSEGIASKSVAVSVGSDSEVVECCLDLTSFFTTFFFSTMISSSSWSFLISLSLVIFRVFVCFSFLDSVGASEISLDSVVSTVSSLVELTIFSSACSSVQA
uniref:Uncharacterized protein n=1 Tax=Cacopsylla melanoneura TaxID=428564 RepID=A0A8D8VVA6_9HEMI